MNKKFSKYKDDLNKIIKEGDLLYLCIRYECYPDSFKIALDGIEDEEEKKNSIRKLSNFRGRYQIWYSEGLYLIKQMLPDRLNDFKKLYEKSKTRKVMNCESYVLEDYLQGLENGFVKTNSGISKFEQQLNILKSVEKRFESSLFDIKQLLQADLFDNELEASSELLNKGFIRGAGAIAGVILEEHFQNVCVNHSIGITKKNPGINDYNDLLKQEGIIEVDIFRFIQRLGDLRNKCDHKKTVEPTKNEIQELIDGTDRIIKTVF